MTHVADCSWMTDKPDLILKSWSTRLYQSNRSTPDGQFKSSPETGCWETSRSRYLSIPASRARSFLVALEELHLPQPFFGLRLCFVRPSQVPSRPFRENHVSSLHFFDHAFHLSHPISRSPSYLDVPPVTNERLIRHRFLHGKLNQFTPTRVATESLANSAFQAGNVRAWKNAFGCIEKPPVYSPFFKSPQLR